MMSTEEFFMVYHFKTKPKLILYILLTKRPIYFLFFFSILISLYFSSTATTIKYKKSSCQTRMKFRIKQILIELSLVEFKRV